MILRDQKWLQRKSLFLVLVFLVLLVGACGDDFDTGDRGADDMNDVWNKHHLPDGNYVNCLTSDGGNGQYRIRGMSCDWVEYHQRVNSGTIYRGTTTPTTLG